MKTRYYAMYKNTIAVSEARAEAYLLSVDRPEGCSVYYNDDTLHVRTPTGTCQYTFGDGEVTYLYELDTILTALDAYEPDYIFDNVE